MFYKFIFGVVYAFSTEWPRIHSTIQNGIIIWRMVLLALAKVLPCGKPIRKYDNFPAIFKQVGDNTRQALKAERKNANDSIFSVFNTVVGKLY